MPYVYIYI